MKKSVIILLTILLIPNILAIQITPSKESYQPQELFQAQITGNFISLSEDQISIYKDGKVHSEPIIGALTKQNDVYYFYAILPNQPGNYSLKIENANYLERGTIKSDPISTPIIILLKNESDLYINPGFILADNDFSIKVKSLYGNTDLTAIFEATGEEKQLSLTEQKEVTLNFNLPLLGPGQTKVTINDYEIPVFLIRNIPPEINLEFIPHIIEGTITSNQEYGFSVLIRNPSNEDLENLVFSSDINTIFSPSTIELLEPNQTAFINITIKIENATNNLKGKITAVSGNETYYLPISFSITQNESEVEVIDATPNQDIGSTLSCSQLGSICLSDQSCNGDTVDSLEGPCCIGICEQSENSSTSTYIGIGLIVILLILIGYVVMRARSKKRMKSAEQILADKQEKYKKRIKGEQVEHQLDSV